MKFHIQRQYIAALPIYWGYFCVGTSMGWSSPVIPKLKNLEETPFENPITLDQSSTIASLIFIGCIIMPNLSWPLANKYGRKLCLYLGAVFNIISWVMTLASTSLALLYASRTILGFGLGLTFVCGIGYIGEIATKSTRGALLTATGTFQALGTVAIYSIGPFISYSGIGIFGLILVLIHGLLLIFIPESPIFYLLQGKEYEAVKTLTVLGRHKSQIEIELEEIKQSLVFTKAIESENSFKKLITIKANRRALFITTVLLILPQLGGAVQVTFFAASIFEAAGSSIDPSIATVITGSVALLTTCFAPIIVETQGRKILLYISTAFNALSLFVLGLYFFLDDRGYTVIENIGWLPLVTMIVFWLSYGLGMDTIPFTLSGELFHVSVKGIGSAIAITTGWTCGFIMTALFGTIISSFGAYTMFWIFSGVKVLAFLHTLLFVPETKGRSLSEIQDILNNRIIMIGKYKK